jgi:hypothetical protein
VLRDLQELWFSNGREFPITWVFILPDGLGNLVPAPYDYSGFQNIATLTPFPACTDSTLPIRVDGLELETASFDGLPEGPYSPPPTTAPPTTPTTAPTTQLPTPTTTEAPPPPVVAAANQSACDPNYSGACVPTGAGDVNCPQVPGTNFQVVGTDVYNLDSDNDLVACEQDESTAPSAAAGATTTGELANTGQSSKQLYGWSLILLAVGLALVVAGAAVVPGVTVPKRGGFTVTRLDRLGRPVTTRVVASRSKRGARR